MSAPVRVHRHPPAHLPLFLDLISLSVRLNSRTTTAFRRIGVGRVEAFLLLYLSQIGSEPCTMRQVRQALQLYNDSLANALNNLERKGYATRRPIRPGVPTKELALTEAGQRLLPQLYTAIDHILPAEEIALEARRLWPLVLKQLLSLTEGRVSRRSAAT